MLERKPHENENACSQECEQISDAFCIETNRIYDSCRNQECIQDARIFVTEEGQKALDHADSIQVKSVKVLWTKIRTEEMPFHKGYFQIHIRYYFYCILDCCNCLGVGQEIAGLCTWEKKVLLYGGEGNTSIFVSDLQNDPCAPDFGKLCTAVNRPRAVVETAEPIALALEICQGPDEKDGFRHAEPIPEAVQTIFGGAFCRPCEQNKVCRLTLGLFSMIRLERPAQLVIPACDFCLPEKCCEDEFSCSDPCALFRSMSFPVNEFYPAINSFSSISAQILQKQTEPCPIDPKKYQ